MALIAHVCYKRQLPTAFCRFIATPSQLSKQMLLKASAYRAACSCCVMP